MRGGPCGEACRMLRSIRHADPPANASRTPASRPDPPRTSVRHDFVSRPARPGYRTPRVSPAPPCRTRDRDPRVVRGRVGAGGDGGRAGAVPGGEWDRPLLAAAVGRGGVPHAPARRPCRPPPCRPPPCRPPACPGPKARRCGSGRGRRTGRSRLPAAVPGGARCGPRWGCWGWSWSPPGSGRRCSRTAGPPRPARWRRWPGCGSTGGRASNWCGWASGSSCWGWAPRA